MRVSSMMFGKIVLISLLAVLAQYVYRVLYVLGVYKTVYTHYPGNCRQVPGIDLGAEDFETLANGLTFITSGFRFNEMPPEADELFKEKKRKGRLYLFDFNHPENNVEELIISSTKIFDRKSFNPHGISVWEDVKNKKVFLFVVNHRTGQSDSIEKFWYLPDETRVEHIKTYTSDTMHVINDVAVTGKNSFYFTNYLYWSSGILQKVEMYLLLHLGEVVYYNGLTFQIVASRIGQANGISLSKDKKFVYVSAILDKEIHIYKKESDGGLTHAKAWPLDTSSDNFAVHPETGDIFIGAHPIIYKYLAHHENPRDVKTPSQVLQLKVKDENVTSVQELFVDATGDLISGSSVALVYKNKLLIGSVMDKLIICDVNIPL